MPVDRKQPRGPFKGKENLETEWTEDEKRACRGFVRDSPVKNKRAREYMAKRAVELDRQCRFLDGRVRTGDEERAFTSAIKSFAKLMDDLGLLKKKSDLDGDL